MPQMFPMNWILMFIIFSLIFIISCNKIFFSNKFNQKMNSSNFFLISPIFFWKW